MSAQDSTPDAERIPVSPKRLNHPKGSSEFARWNRSYENLSQQRRTRLLDYTESLLLECASARLDETG